MQALQAHAVGLYHVDTFIPKVAGCGAADMGWDAERCRQFEMFLNQKAAEGWQLHSHDYRQVMGSGCGASKGVTLVCVFTRRQG